MEIKKATDPAIKDFRRIMIDANVAIAYFDSTHKFHSKAKDIIQNLYINGSSFYYPQPVLLEIKDYWRRKLLTVCIQAHIDNGFRLFNKFEKLFIDFASKNKGEVLRDRQVKDLRETLEIIPNEKGVDLWFKLCNQALNGKFNQLKNTLNNANIRYAKFDDNDVYPQKNKTFWPNWEDMDSLIEKYGLSSSDAAILNMTNGGQNIQAFISNDGDILFAII